MENQDNAMKMVGKLLVDLMGKEPQKLETLRQQIGQIELPNTNPDPNPEDDDYPPNVEIQPTPKCCTKNKNG